MDPDLLQHLDELKTLLAQYVPPGYHLDRARQTLELLPRQIDETLRLSGKCTCGEDLVCPDCDIEVECDPEIRVNSKNFKKFC